MTFEKFSRFIWLLAVWFMYDIAYDGVMLKSIHHNTPKVNINFDGNGAIIIGILAFMAGTYLLYLVLGTFGIKSKNNEID